MNDRPSWNQLYADFVVNRRFGVILTAVLLSLCMAALALMLRVDAGFEKRLPKDHAFMETFHDYKDEFGSANRLLIAVRAVDGEMFSSEFFTTLKNVTDAVFFLPGVDRPSVRSLFTPNVRFVEIVDGGFAGGNVVPAEFQPTPDYLDIVRGNIIKAGIVGRLVADDFSSALVSASLVEFDPATGEKLDMLAVARQIEDAIRTPHISDNIDIHVIGYVKAIGDVADGAAGVLVFFGLAFLLTSALVYLFTGSWALTMCAIGCSLLGVIWTLGSLTLLGFGLDPLSILVPFLIFAIGTSHAAQIVNGAIEEAHHHTTMPEAMRAALSRLIAPGSIAILSDTLGFLTILFIGVAIIQQMAITASVGVMSLVLTNLILLPSLIATLQRRDKWLAYAAKRRDVLSHGLSLLHPFSRPGPACIALALACLLAIPASILASRLQIGDLNDGVPELRPDSRYNQDSALISDRFAIGVDIFTVIAETEADGCINHDVMSEIDRFAWHMRNVEDVRSTLSMATFAKRINAGWNEGHPAWRVLPRNSQVMVQAVTPIETSTGLLNANCSAMPIMIFTADHRAETLSRVADAASGYTSDSDAVRFRLATGNGGIMAATNDVVEASQLAMLAGIYLIILALCLLSFRSLRAAVCIILPLSLVSTLGYALMDLQQIGLTISTLPVAALGVGIGVDYGIYVFAGIQKYQKQGFPLADSYKKALEETGSAVLLTGFTLSIGVLSWMGSDLQFQADMGLLLAFLFFANMIGALVLSPSLLTLWDKYLTKSP